MSLPPGRARSVWTSSHTALTVRGHGIDRNLGHSSVILHHESECNTGAFGARKHYPASSLVIVRLIRTILILLCRAILVVLLLRVHLFFSYPPSIPII